MSFLMGALLTTPVVLLGRHTAHQKKSFIMVVVGCAAVFLLERQRFRSAYPKWEGGDDAVAALASGKVKMPPPPWLLEKSGVRCLREEGSDKAVNILCKG